MSEQEKGSTEDKKSAKDRVSDGIKEGLGVLSAFKDALEETIAEARERGDLSAERAKDAMKSAMKKAQDAAGDAKERLDFVAQRDFDGLRDAVDKIRDRVEGIERRMRGEAPEEGAPEEDESGA